MEAILKFKLPEEQEEFDNAIKGSDWMSVCWEMDQWLRGNIKHAPEDMSEEAYKTYEDCREQLRELINSKALNL